MPLEFALQGDAVSFLIEWILPILAVVGLIALMMWALAYLSRVVEVLKIQESKWFSRDTLDFVRKFVSVSWVILFLLLILWILTLRFEVAATTFAALFSLFPAAFFVAFVLFLAAVTVRVIHHFARYLRGELRTKPRVPAPPRALAMTELVLKYVIYTIAGVSAFVGGVQALPPSNVRDSLAGLVRPEQWTSGLVILTGALLLGFVADRITQSVFEDLKKRSKKFNEKVIDQVKTATRVACFVVIGVVALFLVLNLVLDPTRLFVFSIGFIALVVVVGLAAMDSMQEALAGLGLLMSDPFDVGDRVKIGDDLVCDVVGAYLTMTHVRTLKGELVTLPNSRVRREPIVNFSRSKAYAMFVDVTVGFDVPHARVREVLLEAARRTPGIVAAPPPEVYGKDVLGSSIEYQLLAYTDRPDQMKQIKSDLVFHLQDEFQRFGIAPGVQPR